MWLEVRRLPRGGKPGGRAGRIGAETRYYIVSYSLTDRSDVDKVKKDLERNFIVVLRVTPLLEKNKEEVIEAVKSIYDYVVSIGGDIARLGEDRVVVTPPGVKIWRETSRA
jgi:SepF-like predicted cell division protein (DUF552 family)